MEERKLNEKESLELIARMIQATKQNMKVGSGNEFLLNGYTAAVLSVVIYLLVYFTGNPMWQACWFLMFVPMFVSKIGNRNKINMVITYTDKVISNIWQVVGILFILTALVMAAMGVAFGRIDFGLMLPLALLYVAIGTSVTGVIIKENVLKYAPLLGFVFAIYMLMTYASGGYQQLIWNLYFGLSLVIMLVIPGHILNFKSKSDV